MDTGIILLISVLLASQIMHGTSMRCPAWRFKLNKQKCVPKKGHEGKLQPCMNVCTNKRVPMNECKKHTHCCMYDCRCILKGAGHVDWPTLEKAPGVELKSAVVREVKWDLQAGCKPKLLDLAKPTLASRKPVTRKAKAKTPVRRWKPGLKPGRRPRPRKPLRKTTAKPTTPVRRWKPGYRPTRRPIRRRKPVRKTTTTRKPTRKTTTRKPVRKPTATPKPVTKTTKRTTTASSARPPSTTIRKPKTTKPATTKRTTTECSTKASSFGSLFAGGLSSLLHSFGFGGTLVADPC